MYRHSPHKAGGEIRSWDGLELDDAAQGPASGSAHEWRPCMLPQSEEARPCPLAAEALVPGVFLPRLARVLPEPTVTHPSPSPALTGSRTSLPRGNWVPFAERVAAGFYLWCFECVHACRALYTTDAEDPNCTSVQFIIGICVQVYNFFFGHVLEPISTHLNSMATDRQAVATRK